MPTLWTIGYERLLPPQLVAELQAAGVRRVLDVRIRPQSRRPGMSNPRLGELLDDHGIADESRREVAAELGDAPPTALLCLEADPAHCQRRVVAEALSRRRPGLAIV